MWGQNQNINTNAISQLQDKAIRIISFKYQGIDARPLYYEKKIIQFFDLISFYNCLFVAEHLNENLPSSFGNYFTYMADCHTYNTRGALKKLVNVPQSKTTFYGTQSITAKSVKDWNALQNKIVFDFRQEKIITSKLVSALKKYFLESYNNDRVQ